MDEFNSRLDTAGEKKINKHKERETETHADQKKSL